MQGMVPSTLRTVQQHVLFFMITGMAALTATIPRMEEKGARKGGEGGDRMGPNPGPPQPPFGGGGGVEA